MSSESEKVRLGASEKTTAAFSMSHIGTMRWRSRTTLAREQPGLPSTKPSVYTGALDFFYDDNDEADLSTSRLARKRSPAKSSAKRPHVSSSPKQRKRIDYSKVLEEALSEPVYTRRSADKAKPNDTVQLQPEKALFFAPTRSGDRTQKTNSNELKKQEEHWV